VSYAEKNVLRQIAFDLGCRWVTSIVSIFENAYGALILKGEVTMGLLTFMKEAGEKVRRKTFDPNPAEAGESADQNKSTRLLNTSGSRT
jgi:hypothetical protein